MNVDRALEFIEFIHERHAVYTRRMAGEPGPWTDDHILRSRKFTNVFRWLDPGSQFVIKDLLSDDPETFLMRCFLYRHTGRVEVWEFYDAMAGGYPGLDDLEDVREIFHQYRGKTKTVLQNRSEETRKKGTGGFSKKTGERPLFTSAYLVFPQSQIPGTDKLDSIIDLTARLRDEGVFSRFVKASEQDIRFSILRNSKGVADFMSMQVLTDFGYSTEFREDQFVVPGPGAKKGAAFLGIPAPEAIDWAWRTMLQMPSLEVDGHPRLLSKMDIQNCLCEYSKYVRYQDKPSPEKPYQTTHDVVQLRPTLPPLWR